MAIRTKRVKKSETKNKLPFEQQKDLSKLSLYIVIIDHFHIQSVMNILRSFESNFQFVQRGEGTAPKAILDILGIADNDKDVICSIVKREKEEEIKNGLNAYFSSSSTRKGIGFAIPLSSIIGVSTYLMLANK